MKHETVISSIVFAECLQRILGCICGNGGCKRHGTNVYRHMPNFIDRLNTFMKSLHVRYFVTVLMH